MTSAAANGSRDAVAAGPAWRRWAGPLLLVSLMANLLVVGALAGSYMAGQRHGPLAFAPIDRGLMGYLRTLPDERRIAILTGIEQSRGRLQAERRKVREARKVALSALANEPFDASALESAIAGANAAEGSLQAVSNAIFVSVAKRMTPEERRALKEWREARQHGPHNRRDGKRD